MYKCAHTVAFQVVMMSRLLSYHEVQQCLANHEVQMGVRYVKRDVSKEFGCEGTC